MNERMEAALNYAARGWPVFPCRIDKRPITPHGFKDATTSADRIKTWWTMHPSASIGIPTGLPETFDAIDIDPKREGEDSLSELQQRYGKLPDTAISLTGGGGQHFLFRHRPGVKNSVDQIARGIDIRGEGGYIVVPPSGHPSGRTYEWEASSDPAEKPLADPPDWIAGNGIAKTNGAGNLDFTAGRIPHDGSPVAPGSRNNSLASLAGQWVQAGDDIKTIIAKAHAWNDSLAVPLPKKEVETTAASIVKTHLEKHPLESIPVVEEIPTEIPAFVPRAVPTFPTELAMDAPGFLGQFVRFATENGYREQPVLALAAAIAFAGTVLGRKVEAPDGSRTNFYCIGVSSSGTGKDYARKLVREIAATAGALNLLGGEEFTSDSAISTALSADAANPCKLFQVDEIGHLFCQVNNPKAGGFQKSILTYLTKLWSSANTIFLGKEYANQKDHPRRDLHQPHVCIYGTTVLDTFTRGLSGAEVRDGFLPRFLIFRGDDKAKRIKRTEHGVPAHLVDWVKAWSTVRPREGAGGNLDPMTRAHRIDFANEESAAAIGAVDDDFEGHRIKSLDRHDRLDSIHARGCEQVVKLATLAACCSRSIPGDDSKAVLDIQSVQWAASVAQACIGNLIYWVNEYAGESERERMIQEIASFIGSKSTGVSHRELVRKFQKVRPMERDEMVKDLIDCGRVTAIKAGPKVGPGRPSVILVLSQ